MKKIFLLLLTFIVTLLPVVSYASSSVEAVDEVPLHPEGWIDDPTNRSPTSIPIHCFYSNGELTFTFSANLGTVECEVVRLSDETTFDAIFYAVSGSSESLYVSTDADDYEITLMCADGTIYYGEYSVE